MEWLLFAIALFAAFSNGANDNFKGFATVWGSDTLNLPGSRPRSDDAWAKLNPTITFRGEFHG